MSRPSGKTSTAHRQSWFLRAHWESMKALRSHQQHLVSDLSLTSDSDNVQVVFAVGQGTLNVSTAIAGGVARGQILGNGTSSVTLTASLAAINATLADPNGLTYTPTTGYSGPDTLTATISDLGNTQSGDPQTAAQSVQINVVGPPTITVPAGPLAVDENAALPVSGISVADSFLLANPNNVQVTLAVQQGMLSVSLSVAGGVTSGQVSNDATAPSTLSAAWLRSTLRSPTLMA